MCRWFCFWAKGLKPAMNSATPRTNVLAQNLTKALESTKEIEITVTGRRSGRKITLPVWFVKEDKRLLLLPVRGSGTNWYINLQREPSVKVSAQGTSVTTRASLSENSAKVREVVEKFRAKHGAGDVSRYYSRTDACVEIRLP